MLSETCTYDPYIKRAPHEAVFGTGQEFIISATSLPKDVVDTMTVEKWFEDDGLSKQCSVDTPFLPLVFTHLCCMCNGMHKYGRLLKMRRRVSVRLVQSAVLADECEIIIMTSLCLNKTNTGKKRRGGEESKQNLNTS